jgi:tetratricopeptide (TPR) repeat protein
VRHEAPPGEFFGAWIQSGSEVITFSLSVIQGVSMNFRSILILALSSLVLLGACATNRAVPARETSSAWQQRFIRISALSEQGNESGDKAVLEQAVGQYRQLLSEIDRSLYPDAWGSVQSGLGAALAGLGKLEEGTAHLEEALKAYGEVLKIFTRERMPQEWAEIQGHLGLALTGLGLRESGTVHLEEALKAYGEALKEWTRERDPIQWARVQGNLGRILIKLGEREQNLARLEEASKAFQNAWDTFLQEGEFKYAVSLAQDIGRVEDLIRKLKQ